MGCGASNLRALKVEIWVKGVAMDGYRIGVPKNYDYTDVKYYKDSFCKELIPNKHVFDVTYSKERAAEEVEEAKPYNGMNDSKRLVSRLIS